MKAFLLAAGRGVRFRPVTERIPKPLFPFLNVSLARAHLERLRRQGIVEAGVNLHHLGDEIERHLSDRASQLPKLTFFREDPILGTAGALKNAARWLGEEDFLVVNCDTVIDFDLGRMAQTHAASGRSATLLVVENREPDRYTPLQPEGDSIARFGGEGPRPLLYTGVCLLSGRLLSQIPKGETSLVRHLWEPMLARGGEIGYVLHDGPFADLGRPGDFLRASFEALARGGSFAPDSGSFDAEARTLSLVSVGNFEAQVSVIGRARIASAARVFQSAVWDGVEIGAGAWLERCIAAGGRIPAGTRHADALLWPGPDGEAIAHRLETPVHGFQAPSPRR
jgi:mannose-1-phosphate guanylyltransferase